MLRGHKRVTNIEKFWRKMLAQGEKLFSISDIAESRQEYWSARRYARSLVASGYLEMVGNYNGKNHYKVVKPIKNAPNVKGINPAKKPPTHIEKIWLALPMMGTFKIEDLALHTGIKESTIKSYLAIFCESGILRTQKDGQRLLYKLRPGKYTGPLAPINVKILYDPNTKKYMGIDEKRGANG